VSAVARSLTNHGNRLLASASHSSAPLKCIRAPHIECFYDSYRAKLNTHNTTKKEEVTDPSFNYDYDRYNNIHKKEDYGSSSSSSTSTGSSSMPEFPTFDSLRKALLAHLLGQGSSKLSATAEFVSSVYKVSHSFLHDLADQAQQHPATLA
jgi:hypothetical protein